MSDKSSIQFDKCLIAWGSDKKQTGKKYSNMYEIQDIYSHAKVYNELQNAKTVCILGGSFDAYQQAGSIREYLDSIDKHDTRVVLLSEANNEV